MKEDIEYLKEQEIKFFECIEKKQKKKQNSGYHSNAY